MNPDRPRQKPRTYCGARRDCPLLEESRNEGARQSEQQRSDDRRSLADEYIFENAAKYGADARGDHFFLSQPWFIFVRSTSHQSFSLIFFL